MTTAMFRRLAARIAARIAAGTALSVLAASLITAAYAQTASQCPFNVDQSSANNSTRATTDGLLFIRYALGLPITTPPVANATENAALTPAQVASFMASNQAQLDIDGDGKFTITDAWIIARYLVGYRGSALADDLIARDFSTRFGSTAFQQYIDNGCNAANDPADPRIVVWNAMNAQLALGTTAGIEAAKMYLTDTGIDNMVPVFTALRTELATMISSYSEIIPRTVSADFAEYWISRPLPGSTSGEREVFTITFLRMFDGSWRIDMM